MRFSCIHPIMLFLWGSFMIVASHAFLPSKQNVAPSFVTNARGRSAPGTFRQHASSIHDKSRNRRDRGSIVLFMGWGPEPVWSAAKVTANAPACESDSGVLLTVQVPAETAAEYTVPGQYVQLRLSEETKPLFLAIASAPAAENPSFDFLVKKTEGNEWLTAISAGTAVEVSQVLGNGFAIEENLEGFKYDFPTQNVLLFAAGSGIAPIKAAVESGQLGVQDAKSGGRQARLYYGERSPADLCFVDKFAEWEAEGFEVVPVLSQPEDWQGRTGYVQTALEEDGIAIPRNSGALLCGMKGMTEAVKDLLLKAGVFEGRILFNF